MPLDPQIKDILDELAARKAPPVYTMTPPEARAAMLKARGFFVAESPDLARVENREIPGPAGAIPVRVYAGTTGRPLPILVYFHGGGWVVGDLETHDDLCRRLALQSGCLVVAVAYRLAPEHKFPAAVDDCQAAVQWIAENGGSLGGDPERIAVGGDSAGGNLAAVVALLARDEGGPRIAFQLLIYPATAHDLGSASMQENGKGLFLELEAMKWYYGQYLNGPEDYDNPRFSPINARSLADLPPAYVITAEYDPLRDEGEAYGRRMRDEGVQTTLRRYDGMTHAFFAMTITDRTKEAIREAAEALRATFAG